MKKNYSLVFSFCLLFTVYCLLFFGCSKIEYTVEIRPVKASQQISAEIKNDADVYFRREIKAVRKLKLVAGNADKIITPELYIDGNKTHLDVFLTDAKTNRVEYENRRFWKEPKLHDIRFLIKKIFVDMEMNHFKWNRGLME